MAFYKLNISLFKQENQLKQVSIIPKLFLDKTEHADHPNSVLVNVIFGYYFERYSDNTADTDHFSIAG